jgi:hypothetical protein
VEQKRREGNPGKRALPAVGSLAAVPALDAPVHELPPLEVFDRTVQYARAWIADTEAWKLAMLREQLEEREDLRRAVMEGHGNRKDLRDLEKAISDSAGRLGLDTAARSALGLAEVKAASKLEELRARQQNG